MKNGLIRLICLMLMPASSMAANLLEVYQQAQTSDPTYQEAISQRLSDKQGVPISIANLLPNLQATVNPSVTRSGFSGSLYNTDVDGTPLSPRNNTTRAYTLALTATQTVFDFAKFSQVAGSLDISKGADATLNAALQDLMVRVSKAYFAILEDEDNVSYSLATKDANAEQLHEVQQQYQVGIKTKTDVYTAQARYDSSVANYIQAQTDLANDRENLRVITGKYYPDLASLSENFPLITPRPANIEAWVQTAQLQNWTIKKFQYNVDNSRQIIRQQFAGHLPTIDLEGLVDRQYTNNINAVNSINEPRGPGTETDKQIMFTVTMPLFAGGGVVAQTNQATYNYQVAQQQLEKVTRDTINNTRQSYLNVISGVSQIQADKQAIKSNVSSLEGMQASYEAGTETLVNVLNQREILYKSQTDYASDRYSFVNNILLLKQAAGTLSFDDLRAINAWLVEDGRRYERTVYKKYHRYSATKKMSKKKVKRKHLVKKHKNHKKHC